MSNQHYDKYVPDSGPLDAKIIFVGEAPGETEMEQGAPFVGPSGSVLNNTLNNLGLTRDDVRYANLCHYRPYANKFENLIGSQVLKQGLGELYDHIKHHKPNLIVPLGAFPLLFLTGKKGIKRYRGSILSYINDESIKVIPTFHPSAVLREGALFPTFNIDLRRIVSDAAFPEKNLPVREFHVNPSGLQLREWTDRLCTSEYLGTDNETVKRSKHILCVGFSPDPAIAVCIVPEDEEKRGAIRTILESSAKKVFQFGNFDYRQLVDNGYTVNDPDARAVGRLYWWDTLVAQHAQSPELPRSLEYLTSVYTREPYYKTEGRGTIPDDNKGWNIRTNRNALYEYNCRDCCCTSEIYRIQNEELYGDNSDRFDRDTFEHEMSLIDTADELSSSGMMIDQDRRRLLEIALLGKWQKKQFILDRMVGYETNVRSPKLKDVLYGKDYLGLPTRRNRDGSITTDEDAIVSLIAFCKDKLDSVVREETKLDWRIKLAVCQTILEIRGIRQVLSNYVLEQQRNKSFRASSDGRIRSTVKIAGTETGRTSASKYLDGTGWNAQTLPRDPIEVEDSELTLHEGVLKLKSQLSAEDFEVEDEEEEYEVA